MTEQNSFFQEIADDVERKKLEAFWKRYGALIIAAAVAVVIATGGYSLWQSHKTEKEQKQTAGLIDIMASEEKDDKKQIAALETFAKSGGGSVQSTFARLQAADLAARSGDKKQAIMLFDAVGSDTKADPAFRQLAELLSVQQQMDDGNAVALQQRLQPLLASGSPWHATAMEYSGYLALRAGDKAKAKQIFADLSADSNAPSTIAARAADMARFLSE